MTDFKIIGIDDNQEQYFNQEISNIIAENTVFSGGKRHYEITKKYLPKDHLWIEIKVPLDNVFEQYKDHKTIVVFASGDPLFYGFANTIQRKMPTANMKVFPFFNSLQLLAHRMLLPYQDMHIVSLTGRPWHKFDEALISGFSLIGILTDNKIHTPANIAQRMMDYGFTNYKMTIGELLGNKEKEKHTTLSINEVHNNEYAFPNNIILQKTYSLPRPLGVPETNFHLLNGRAKMITKMPIRLLSLSMLDLRQKTIFWDIGFCTASVSVEAKMQFPHLQIFAFEKREEGAGLIQNNSQKFHTPGIESFIGDFTTTDVSSLPLPDAVFIGGHGGKMAEIIAKISPLLTKNGCIVFNAVSEDTKALFHTSIEHNNLTISDSINIQIDDFNKINVLKAIKK